MLTSPLDSGSCDESSEHEDETQGTECTKQRQSAEVIQKLKDHERGRIKRDEGDSGSIMIVHTGIKGHKHLTSSDCGSVGSFLYTQVTPSSLRTFNSP
ncbi:uncharacterized [Tachysurus ichikawai]